MSDCGAFYPGSVFFNLRNMKKVAVFLILSALVMVKPCPCLDCPGKESTSHENQLVLSVECCSVCCEKDSVPEPPCCCHSGDCSREAANRPKASSPSLSSTLQFVKPYKSTTPSQLPSEEWIESSFVHIYGSSPFLQSTCLRI